MYLRPEAYGPGKKKFAEAKFGRNLDVDTTRVSLWSVGGLYPWATMTAIPTLQVVSADADDTVLGNGARTVEITGLDSNYAIQVQELDMDGQTPVPSGLSWSRVVRMRVLTAGVTGYNEGLISMGVSGGATIASIPATENQSLMAVYTIPAGYTGYLVDTWGSVAKGKDATFSLFTREFGGVFNLRNEISIYQAHSHDEWPDPLPLPEKTDIDMRVTSENINTPVRGGFNLILEDGE